MRVLVVGYAGEGNAGDDILLSRLIEGISDARVLAAWGSNSAWDHPDVETISRNLPDLFAAVDDVDAVIIGPGGILHNVRGYANPYRDPGLAYYDALTAAAASKGKAVGAIGIGIGPLVGPTARRITQRILARCTTISVRDEESKSIANSLGIMSVDIVRDLAITGVRSPDETRNRTTLGVCLRPWKSRAETEQLCANVAAAIDLVVSSGTITRVVGIPMSISEDPGLDDRWPIALTLGSTESAVDGELLEIGSPTDYPTILSSLAVMASMRLHGLILAHNVGTPVLGLTYDPKVRNATAGMGIELVDLSDAPRTIASRIQTAIESEPLSDTDPPESLMPYQMERLKPSQAPLDLPGPVQRRVEAVRLAAGL